MEERGNLMTYPARKSPTANEGKLVGQLEDFATIWRDRCRPSTNIDGVVNRSNASIAPNTIESTAGVDGVEIPNQLLVARTQWSWWLEKLTRHVVGGEAAVVHPPLSIFIVPRNIGIIAVGAEEGMKFGGASVVAQMLAPSARDPTLP